MLTFNASGGGNCGLNLLYYLPHFTGKEQMKDEDELLTSFCYELLRNNGPPAMLKMGFKDSPENEDYYSVVNTSKGEVRSREERSDELRIRQLRLQFVCASSFSLDIDATITAT